MKVGFDSQKYLSIQSQCIRERIEKYGGERVAWIKDVIKDDMIADGLADIIYDFAQRPVICRCGTKCVVKIMDDQWFLKYGDEEWTAKTEKLLAQETIIPEEIRPNFEYYLDWLDNWASLTPTAMKSPFLRKRSRRYGMNSSTGTLSTGDSLQRTLSETT